MVQLKSNGKSGVILCECNGELNRNLDFSSLEKKLNELSTVARVKRCSRLCDSKDCADAVKVLKKSGISRFVVGGCGNDTLDTVLRDTLEKNGLISRVPGQPRSIRLLVAKEQIPQLD